jgi:hypothetical protein
MFAGSGAMVSGSNLDECHDSLLLRMDLDAYEVLQAPIGNVVFDRLDLNVIA